MADGLRHQKFKFLLFLQGYMIKERKIGGGSLLFPSCMCAYPKISPHKNAEWFVSVKLGTSIKTMSSLLAEIFTWSWIPWSRVEFAFNSMSIPSLPVYIISIVIFCGKNNSILHFKKILFWGDSLNLLLSQADICNVHEQFINQTASQTLELYCSTRSFHIFILCVYCYFWFLHYRF